MTLKEIREIAFAHKSYANDWTFKSYVALIGLERRNVTEEQVKEAKVIYNKLKAEKIDSIKKWQLIFVGMWMTNDSDIGNFRIRTYIHSYKTNKKFFIELLIREDEIFISSSVDVDLQEHYNKRLTEAFNQKLWETNPAEWELLNSQPYYGYNKELWKWFLSDKRPLKRNVVSLVNLMYDTHFVTMEVDNYLLTEQDYISVG